MTGERIVFFFADVIGKKKKGTRIEVRWRVREGLRSREVDKYSGSGTILRLAGLVSHASNGVPALSYTLC